jgi:uridine kinase
LQEKEFELLTGKIDGLLTGKESVIIAADGGSAAGKSSLAARLSERYFCNVISMDDFFLRPIQRTPQRLGEAGGNIDYERFIAEIVRPLKTGGAFSYRPYDCRIQSLTAPVDVTPGRLTVIEGVYSMHPLYRSLYGLSVFLNISAETQLRRISERNPMLAERFISEWIPMENAYFDAFKIPEKCDLLFEID